MNSIKKIAQMCLAKMTKEEEVNVLSDSIYSTASLRTKSTFAFISKGVNLKNYKHLVKFS